MSRSSPWDGILEAPDAVYNHPSPYLPRTVLSVKLFDAEARCGACKLDSGVVRARASTRRLCRDQVAMGSYDQELSLAPCFSHSHPYSRARTGTKMFRNTEHTRTSLGHLCVLERERLVPPDDPGFARAPQPKVSLGE